MDNINREALSIFYPHLLEREQEVTDKNLRFVQYTNAEAAMSIIQNQEIWMRNVQCMNDYMETEHGFQCLYRAYASEEGLKFRSQMNDLFPGITKEIEDLFNGWLPHIQTETYISCVSEHLPSEDNYGRLSMWRAYGGKQPVALVMKGKALQSESDVFKAFTYPVIYKDPEDCDVDFGELFERIEAQKDFVSHLGREKVTGYLFELFKAYALCVKHPGFHEEREWRVIYNPKLDHSAYVKQSILSINGIPQTVHKVPLGDIPEVGHHNGKISDNLDRIIIGPTDHQQILQQTFINLLREVGCECPEKMVFLSGVPLR